jgi:hypothetical protein
VTSNVVQEFLAELSALRERYRSKPYATVARDAINLWAQVPKLHLLSSSLRSSTAPSYTTSSLYLSTAPSRAASGSHSASLPSAYHTGLTMPAKYEQQAAHTGRLRSLPNSLRAETPPAIRMSKQARLTTPPLTTPRRADTYKRSPCRTDSSETRSRNCSHTNCSPNTRARLRSSAQLREQSDWVLSDTRLSTSGSSTDGMLAVSASLLDMPCTHVPPGLRTSAIQKRVQMLQQHVQGPKPVSPSTSGRENLSPFPLIRQPADKDGKSRLPALEIQNLRIRTERQSCSSLSNPLSPLSTVETPLTDCLRAFFGRCASHCCSDVSHSPISDPQSHARFSTGDAQVDSQQHMDQVEPRLLEEGVSSLARTVSYKSASPLDTEGNTRMQYGVVQRVDEPKTAETSAGAQELATAQDILSLCGQQVCAAEKRPAGSPSSAGQQWRCLSARKGWSGHAVPDSSVSVPIDNAEAASCAEKLRQRYPGLAIPGNRAMPSSLSELVSPGCQTQSLKDQSLSAGCLAESKSAAPPQTQAEASRNFSRGPLADRRQDERCASNPADVAELSLCGMKLRAVLTDTAAVPGACPAVPPNRIEGLSGRAQQLVAEAWARLTEPQTPSDLSNAQIYEHTDRSVAEQTGLPVTSTEGSVVREVAEAAKDAATSRLQPSTAGGLCEASGEAERSALAGRRPAVPKALLACKLSPTVLSMLHEAFSSAGMAQAT